MGRENPRGVPAGEGDESQSKAELSRQMEETRDSISETVAEIKTVVSQQYEEVRERVETVKEGVGEVLDWREQFERNPLVWGAGAVSVGILIGLGLAQAFDDEQPARGRRRKKSPGVGGHVVGELTALADAVLPTISEKVKEMFGLDLSEYVGEVRKKRLAGGQKTPRKRAAKKPATKARTAKKSQPAKRRQAAKRNARGD